MRAKKEFNRYHFFSTNKQYLKIKLMQNETICLMKTKYSGDYLFDEDEIFVKL